MGGLHNTTNEACYLKQLHKNNTLTPMIILGNKHRNKTDIKRTMNEKQSLNFFIQRRLSVTFKTVFLKHFQLTLCKTWHVGHCTVYDMAHQIHRCVRHGTLHTTPCTTWYVTHCTVYNMACHTPHRVRHGTSHTAPCTTWHVTHCTVYNMAHHTPIYRVQLSTS